MKKILKLVIYIFVFIFCILIFLPKESLYNLLEKELYTQEIIISNEVRNEELLEFSINNYELYIKGIKVANINKSSFFSLLFFTKIYISNIELDNSFKNMIPSPIINIEISHLILDYNNLKIKSIGKFGKINGIVDILNRKINIELQASKLMKESYFDILNKMKLKDGKYLYEYKF